MRRLALALVLSVCACPSVWAIYGVNTDINSSDSTFVWVGQVNGASGVVIDPHWVLTAQHVGGNQITLDGTTYTADATYDAPSYDLHLMHFASAFGGYYPLYSGNPLGQTATLVGFGDSGSLRADGMGYNDLGGAGTRRTATNTIGLQQSVAYGAWNTPCILADLDAPVGNGFGAPYNRDWFGDGGPTSNEGGLMAGDSGGAWMIDDGGTWKVAGISNYIVDDPAYSSSDPNPLYAFGISGSSAADLTDPGVRGWITTTVPEPTSLAAIGLGMFAFLGKRRRRETRV